MTRPAFNLKTIFRLILGTVLIVSLGLLGFGLYVVPTARTAAMMSSSHCHLKQIGLLFTTITTSTAHFRRVLSFAKTVIGC